MWYNQFTPKKYRFASKLRNMTWPDWAWKKKCSPIALSTVPPFKLHCRAQKVLKFDDIKEAYDLVTLFHLITSPVSYSFRAFTKVKAFLGFFCWKEKCKICKLGVSVTPHAILFCAIMTNRSKKKSFDQFNGDKLHHWRYDTILTVA